MFENPTEVFYDLYIKHLPDTLANMNEPSKQYSLFSSKRSRIQLHLTLTDHLTEKAEMQLIANAMSQVQEQLNVYRKKGLKITHDLDQMREEMRAIEGSEEQTKAVAADEDEEDKKELGEEAPEEVRKSSGSFRLRKK